MNTDLLRRFAELALEEKDLKARLDAVKARKARLEQPAMDELLTAGLANAPLTIGITVYVETTLWAKACRMLGPDGQPVIESGREKPDWPRACAALERAGLGEYVGPQFNVSSLSAFFREQRRELEERLGRPAAPEEVLSPGLEGYVDLNDVVKLKAVRNNAAAAPAAA